MDELLAGDAEEGGAEVVTLAAEGALVVAEAGQAEGNRIAAGGADGPIYEELRLANRAGQHMAVIRRVKYGLAGEAVRYCLIAEQAFARAEPVGVVTMGADSTTGIALAGQAVSQLSSTGLAGPIYRKVV